MKKDAVIHPFLFAMFPVISFFSHNVELSPPDEVLLPLILTVLLTLMLWWLLTAAYKDARVAGFMTSLFSLLFFSYGHVKRLATGLPLVAAGRGVDIQILVVWAAVLVAGSIYAIKRKSRMGQLTAFLNLVAAFVVAAPLLTAAYGMVSRAHAAKPVNIEADRHNSLPSIYYIVLDGYARSDVLKEIYGYDNSEFLEYLEGKGFFIAEKSRSNYAMTSLSIPSSLNFTYLDDLASRMDEDSRDSMPLIDMVHDSSAARFLRQQGYKFVVLSSGYALTDVHEADMFMAPRFALTEFQNCLVNATPIPVLLDTFWTKSQFDMHRERILLSFKNLREIGKEDGPLFVFAHIVAPHPPYVFGEKGEHIRPEGGFTLESAIHVTEEGMAEYIAGYKGQAAYVTKLVIETVDEILAGSKEPPVIIIQADHGPGARLDWVNPENTYFRERMSILNAYYLPGESRIKPYEDITPVNTFRLVFNRYFGTGLDMLPDESYFSRLETPYRFIDVTDRVTP